MQWKREKYGGIQSIRVPPSQVWTPDVRSRCANIRLIQLPPCSLLDCSIQ